MTVLKWAQYKNVKEDKLNHQFTLEKFYSPTFFFSLRKFHFWPWIKTSERVFWSFLNSNSGKIWKTFSKIFIQGKKIIEKYVIKFLFNGKNEISTRENKRDDWGNINLLHTWKSEHLTDRLSDVYITQKKNTTSIY
jgi:hypothetical protein